MRFKFLNIFEIYICTKNIYFKYISIVFPHVNRVYLKYCIFLRYISRLKSPAARYIPHIFKKYTQYIEHYIFKSSNKPSKIVSQIWHKFLLVKIQLKITNLFKKLCTNIFMVLLVYTELFFCKSIVIKFFYINRDALT